MPELPEVETIAADVRPHLIGSTIRRCRVLKPDILRRISARSIERALTGRRILDVRRRAKHLVITLDDRRRLVIQPRMTGALLVDPPAVRAGEESDRYDALKVLLDSGVHVRYRDVRRLGVVLLLDEDEWSAYEARVGPEPLERSFTPAVLRRALRGDLLVKKALMDQRRLAGVGNIYANEALWLARVDPSRPCRSLLASEVTRLHHAVVDVLRRAVEGRGTTLRDYRRGTGEPGAFQERLAVYGRAGEACLRCRGGKRVAVTHALDGRATYFCPGCQR